MSTTGIATAPDAVAARRKLIVEMSAQDVPVHRQAEILGVSVRTVQRVRRKTGISVGTSTFRLTEQEKIKADILFEDGANFVEVAQTLGRSLYAIRANFPGRGWTCVQAGSYARQLDRLRRRNRATAELIRELRA